MHSGPRAPRRRAAVCSPATSPAEPPVPSFPEISRGPRRALRGTESRQGALPRSAGWFPPTAQAPRWYGTAFAKSTMMPSTDRSTVGPTATEAIARVSAAIVRSSSPQRLNLASTSAASRAVGGGPHIPCRNQHRQQRSRTHQEEKRLPIHHNSIDVPIAERRIGAGRDDLRCRQQRAQHSCRPKYDHVPV